ncbi:hypothetical protein EH196_17965 [Bacillus sp. C1-1]|nr:hypothetical protein EH196_17965 [Bacillus sp. C1-1]
MSKSNLNKFLFSSAVVAGVVAVAPQVSEAAVGDQTLKQGMSHQDVTELQNILKEKGFFTYHKATGYFGTYTRDAVLDYQKENNLRVDGIAGPETFGSLLGKESTTKVEKKETTTTQSNLLRIGSRGNDVTNLQDELRSLGYFNQSSTGYYGSITRDAVVAFQKAQNLRLVDGIVGPETRSALGTADAKPAASETASTETSAPAKEEPKQEATKTVEKEQAPAETPASSSMRVGVRGENVTDLQQQLRSLGYFNAEPTGYFGEITKKAVMEFQRTNGISVDGIAGPATVRTLSGSPASASTGSSSSSNESTSTESSSSSNESTSTESNASSNDSTASESTSSNNTAAAPAPSTNTNTNTNTNNAAPVTNTNTSNTSTSSSSNVVSGLISSAQSVIGVPYLWGGTSPAGFDCSGMIQYIFRQNGIELPRTAAAQWNAGTSVGSPSIGDIVFFETYAAGPTHNGIYIGDNKFIHTGSSRGVEVSDLNNSYWAPRYLGAKRLH